MTWPPLYVYLATACVVMIAGGQLLFKIAANQMRGPDLFANPQGLAVLVLALAIYGVATIAWILVLREAPLSRVYPIMALAFVIVPLGSRLFLGESLAPQYWAGVAFLALGLVLIGRAGHRADVQAVVDTPGALAEARRPRVAVVIPCFKVRRHILEVIAGVGPEADAIYCVDDACPDRSGDLVAQACDDPRVRVVRHQENQGVGRATLTGYRQAMADGADILVKLDGDGQMDPALLELFIGPIRDGRADYTKGNRFYNLEDLRGMPPLRLFGNACLSFVTKLSSGYWTVFDPTNGYTAIERTLAERIVRRQVARRYFFESDMLFHLYMERAVVADVPIPARYADEVSNLRIGRVLGDFAMRHLRNMGHRVMVQHYLRDFSLGSVELVAGLLALGFGVAYGAGEWAQSIATGRPASAGSVMLSAMPILVGVQLCLSALNFDIQSVPRTPRHPQLRLLARLAAHTGREPAAGPAPG